MLQKTIFIFIAKISKKRGFGEAKMAPKTDFFELWGSFFDHHFSHHILHLFVHDFLSICGSPNFEKIAISLMENHDFYKIDIVAMETKFHRKITSQTLRFGSQNHQKTPNNLFKKHSKKQLIFKTLLFRFWEGFGIPGFGCWASFGL